MTGWFLSSIHFTTNEKHQQQNTSKQLAQCSFDHVCSCMDPFLFSSTLTETRTVDDVSQGFPEVGWYGKTCLNCLWILLVKSAVRILMCLDGFFTHFTTHFTTNTTNTTNTTQPYRIPTTTCAMKFSPCLFLHGFCSGLQHAVRNRYSGLCWPRLFPEVGWYSKTCLNSLLNQVVESAVS